MTNKLCDDCEQCKMFDECFPEIPKIYDIVTNTWVVDPYFQEGEN